METQNPVKSQASGLIPARGTETEALWPAKAMRASSSGRDYVNTQTYVGKPRKDM